jgi:hypothetical protein
MSGPARNYRLAAGIVAASEYIGVYTVPSGYVCLLKSMLCGNLGASPASGMFELHTPGVQIDIAFNNLGYSEHFEWSGWTALNAGDWLALYTNAGPLHYWLAGALLSGFTSVPAGPAVQPAGPIDPRAPAPTQSSPLQRKRK